MALFQNFYTVWHAIQLKMPSALAFASALVCTYYAHTELTIIRYNTKYGSDLANILPATCGRAQCFFMVVKTARKRRETANIDKVY